MATGENNVATNKIEFPQFDILSEGSAHSDHHFIDSYNSKKTQDWFKNPSSSVSKKIAKEWKILEKHLPESIYVRVYEQRIDLIRAAIIGAAGTPYHDGLFFFDIVLPSDYPNLPPKVYYHSHGLSLNPNLYAYGMVCLSLINTWGGQGVELWRPAKSTILQLLVSIQGLVLNSKPFFNDPAHEDHQHSTDVSWIKKSMAYNEEVIILSCKAMLYNLQKPPQGFQGFVLEHFRKRGDFILAAIKAYSSGSARVGEYQEGTSVSLSPIPVSGEFKADLEKIYSSLCSAFRGIDTLYTKMKNEEASAAVKSQASVKGSKKGILNKIFKVLKKIFK